MPYINGLVQRKCLEAGLFEIKMCLHFRVSQKNCLAFLSDLHNEDAFTFKKKSCLKDWYWIVDIILLMKH